MVVTSFSRCFCIGYGGDGRVGTRLSDCITIGFWDEFCVSCHAWSRVKPISCSEVCRSRGFLILDGDGVQSCCGMIESSAGRGNWGGKNLKSGSWLDGGRNRTPPSTLSRPPSLALLISSFAASLSASLSAFLYLSFSFFFLLRNTCRVLSFRAFWSASCRRVAARSCEAVKRNSGRSRYFALASREVSGGR